MSVPSWVKVGAKVVCVDDSLSEDGIQCPLSLGYVYTVLKVWPRIWNITDQWTDIGVELIEQGVSGRAFWIARFRPLVAKTAEQDIALFRRHLDGVDA